jgi:hypothetical protein
MKNLILILFTLLIISCENNLITKTCNPGRGYRVDRIEAYKERAKYYLDSDNEYVMFNNRPYLIDSIGKYEIDDTVFITLEK